MNTADALKSQNSVYEIGAGRVDAYEAAHANAAFTIADETFTIGSNHKERLIKEITGALSYGTFFDTGAVIEAERTISIENNSEEDKTYKVKVNYQALKGSLPAEENGVVLETTSSVTVKAGSKDGVNAKLHIPITAKNGTYEGYVTFTNINSPDETYQVPFAARKVQEGVAFVNMTDILTTIRNPGDVGNTVMTQLSGSFQLNSHMKSVDTFLTNAEGQDLGFIGSMDGTWIGENTQISLYNVFDGKYYPFTNDKEKPIAYETRVAEPGSYKIKFVFTDDKGKDTIIEKPFILDHEAPTVEASLAEGIIEIEPALSTVAFSGNVYDKQIEEAAASGAAVTQGNNKLFIRDQNGYPQQYTLDPSGNFQVNRNFPTYLKVLPLTVFAKDRAGSTSTQKEYFFVRKGTNYISTVANQKDVQSGDSITFTSTIHNSTSWTEAKWTYQFNKNVITVESIEVPAEWQSQIALEKTETASGITITLKSLDGAIPAADKMPLLQVKAKAKDDKYIDQYVTLTAASPVFTKEDGTKINAGAAQPSVKVQPKHSQLYGDLNGEAIYTRDGFGNLLTTYVDYLALGATVKVKDESGNVYEGKILKDAKFIVDGLPSDRRTLTFELDVPSHFTVQKTVTIGKPNSMPQQQYLTFKPALAGDVNKDNVIDIDDAIYVKEHWSSADRQADINFDGKVDQKDMSYIQANYLLENQMVTPSKKPREKAESKTLSDILSNLQ
ncbi:Fn3-like domain-containing protein [Ectobacillus sp. JY-23]|nr:Fn3-like domain-containing protein [Ectobacillus sp. JY-23]